MGYYKNKAIEEGVFDKPEPEYDEAMNNMDCWLVENHLKNCKKCQKNTA